MRGYNKEGEDIGGSLHFFILVYTNVHICHDFFLFQVPENSDERENLSVQADMQAERGPIQNQEFL